MNGDLFMAESLSTRKSSEAILELTASIWRLRQIPPIVFSGVTGSCAPSQLRAFQWVMSYSPS